MPRAAGALRSRYPSCPRELPAPPILLPRNAVQVDALEGRFAQAVGYRGATPKEVMQRLAAQLGEIEAALAPSPANGGGLQVCGWCC